MAATIEQPDCEPEVFPVRDQWEHRAVESFAVKDECLYGLRHAL
jgi:hypothetical protein